MARSAIDIPIFHEVYDLYKLLHELHVRVPKAQRYTLWQKCQNITLDILELVIKTGQEKERLPILVEISHKVDLLKVLFRLAKETKTIDLKSYVKIESIGQEVGKMVGGWIKSVPC